MFFELKRATGTADLDAASASRDPDSLTALGTAEVTMITVFHPGEKLQESTVFFLPCSNVP